MEKGTTPSSLWHGARFLDLSAVTNIAESCGLNPGAFRGVVHVSPVPEDTDYTTLEALDAEARLGPAPAAAFIAASFLKK